MKTRFYGDSITLGITGSGVVNTTFAQLFADRTQANMINRAISGTSWSPLTGRTRLLTTLQQHLIKYEEGEIIETDANADHLFINCGINDYTEQVNLDVFRASVRETFDYIISHVAQPVVYIMSPFNIDYSLYANLILSLNSYRAVLQQEAERYGFYYINGADFPLPIMADNYIYSDGLHLKQLGHTLIGQKLVYLLTKNYLADSEQYMTHTEQGGLMNTQRTTLGGKPIWRYTFCTANKNNTNILTIMQNQGYSYTHCYLLKADGYAGDSGGINRVPLNWMGLSGTAVSYHFTAYLATNGNIEYNLPGSSYTNFAITFEFWAE
jgi:lysophospholipase L1-like esterase